jgi:acetate CoA/acetoacetate CoA-transferase beta subunit
MLPELKPDEARGRIARRIALELNDGDVVNLGIGIPTLVSKHIPKGINVVFHTENGAAAFGPKRDSKDLRYIDAGGGPITPTPGISFFASDVSFGIARGGHLDLVVLGSLQVSAKGDIANWIVPGKTLPGMGGAMDLIAGAKRVLIGMTHLSRGGDFKIVEECTLPLTAKRAAEKVFTEFAVFEFPDGVLTLTEHSADVGLKDIKEHTGAKFEVSSELKEMKFAD